MGDTIAMGGGEFSFGTPMLMTKNEALNQADPKDLLAMLIRTIEKIPRGDAIRKGMLDTPERIVKSWAELFDGYEWDDERIHGMLTQFDEPCNGQVLLRNIEFNSVCEHHWLPFVGTAHVAYISNGNKVVGVSKLARLVDIFAHRFQIQERIGQQVVEALMEHLNPKGAACVIQAKHLCMSCRGVEKQHSEMITSNRQGCYEDAGADSWREFFQLVSLQ